MSKFTELIKKIKLIPFAGKTGKGDARKDEPIPVPKDPTIKEK